MSTDQLGKSAQAVQDALHANGLQCEVKELPDTTRSAKDAAAAIGCEVREIAKSIVFKSSSGAPVLVIASGTNRVNEAKVAEVLGEGVTMASPDFVREHTGFAIGGVPPLGHPAPITTLLDEDLLTFTTVWAAAGTPFSVFSIEPQALASATGGRVINVA